jgi:hypothetical protein
MFHVGRFDPKLESTKHEDRFQKKKHDNEGGSRPKRKRRRKGAAQNEQPEDASMQVIAPEAKGPISSFRKQGKIEKEAFDDLELEDTHLPSYAEEDEGVAPAAAAAQKGGSDNRGVTDPTPEEIRNAIGMSSVSIKEAADAWKLAPFLVKNLEKEGFQEFFPVQALVIPDIISSDRYAYIGAQDICVAAPTGSGKVCWSSVQVDYFHFLRNRPSFLFPLCCSYF